MPIMELPPPTKAEMLSCLDRELQYRRFVYPSLVSRGKMSQKMADRQIEIMTAIRTVIDGGK